MRSLVSRGFAPVLRALGRPADPESEPLADLSLYGTRNTFIDTPTPRSPSLEEFLLERQARSCPGSAVEAEDAPPPAKAPARRARGLEADSSARSRSTSAGSSTSPGSDTESCDGLSPASGPSEAGESPEAHSRSLRRPDEHSGLPEFDYPAPLFIKNTFIAADIGRPASMEGFYHERTLQSCPASGIELFTEELSEATGSARRRTAQGAEALAQALAPGMPWPAVPPPAAPPAPALVPELPERTPPAPAWPAQASAPPLSLADALRIDDAPSLELPSVGSRAHGAGCSPCAHAYSAKGCRNGIACTFCHLCSPGELKRRQKAKRLVQRAELCGVQRPA